MRYFTLSILLCIVLGLSSCDRSDSPRSSVSSEEPARNYTGPPETDIQEQLRRSLDTTQVDATQSDTMQVNATAGRSLPFDGDRLRAVRSVYAGRDYRPIWTGNGTALGRAAALLRAIQKADQHALNPASYDLQPIAAALRASYQQIQGVPDDSLTARRADLDLRLSDLFMRFGRDIAQGPFRPGDVGADWYVADPTIDIERALIRAADGEVGQALRRLASVHEDYAQLQEQLRRYQQIAEDGGFPKLSNGATLVEGDSGTRVVALRKRLALEMEVPGAPADGILNGELVRALAAYQKRRGLQVDSVLGPNTVRELNTPVERRIEQIQANLIRWQWLPTDLGSRHILVNLPAYQLRAYDGGEEVLTMPVIVGADYGGRATPVFSDSLTYAEFRPYWNIPHSIAADEIVPAALGNPGYMQANGYELVRDYDASPEDTLPPTASNLRAAAAGDLLIRQKPGPENALGLVKYMFPNSFAIYLHDTPADNLFDRRERAFSHGCVRVEDPPRLGAFVFQEKGWGAEDIARRMQEDNPATEVEVPTPIPVYMMYLTAFLGSDGAMNFRDDLYDYDTPILEALAAREVTPVETPVEPLVDLLPAEINSEV